MPSEPLDALRLDRREGDRAILEVSAGEYIEIPARLLPADAVEGSLLRLTLAPASAAAAVQTEAEARLARLKARSPARKIIDL